MMKPIVLFLTVFLCGPTLVQVSALDVEEPVFSPARRGELKPYLRILHVDYNYLLVGALDYLYNLSTPSLAVNEQSLWMPDGSDTALCLNSRGVFGGNCESYVNTAIKTSNTSYEICASSAKNPVCREWTINDQGKWEYDLTSATKFPYHLTPILPWDSNKMFLADYGALYVLRDRKFYIQPAAEWCPLLYRHNVHRNTQFQTSDCYQHFFFDIDHELKIAPKYASIFQDADSVFATFTEPANKTDTSGLMEQRTYPRIARVCKSDYKKDFEFETLMKTRLLCGRATKRSNPSYAYITEEYDGFYSYYFSEIAASSQPRLSSLVGEDGEEVILAIFNTDKNKPKASAICAYRMSDIINAFNAFNVCEPYIHPTTTEQEETTTAEEGATTAVEETTTIVEKTTTWQMSTNMESTTTGTLNVPEQINSTTENTTDPTTIAAGVSVPVIGRSAGSPSNLLVNDNPSLQRSSRSVDDEANNYFIKNLVRSIGQTTLYWSDEQYRMTNMHVDWQVEAKDGNRYDVIFASTDDGQLLKFVYFSLPNKDPSYHLVEERPVFPGQEIYEMKLMQDEDENKYLLLNTQDEIKRVVMVGCNYHIDCSSCVIVGNPYCYWTGSTCVKYTTQYRNSTELECVVTPQNGSSGNTNVTTPGNTNVTTPGNTNVTTPGNTNVTTPGNTNLTAPITDATAAINGNAATTTTRHPGNGSAASSTNTRGAAKGKAGEDDPRSIDASTASSAAFTGGVAIREDGAAVMTPCAAAALPVYVVPMALATFVAEVIGFIAGMAYAKRSMKLAHLAVNNYDLPALTSDKSDNFEGRIGTPKGSSDLKPANETMENYIT